MPLEKGESRPELKRAGDFVLLTMQRKADEIFRVKDLSLLKSPIPGHIRPVPSTPNQKTEFGNSNNGIHLAQPKIFAPSPGIIRPSFMTPKPMMAPPPIRLRPSSSLLDNEKYDKETKMEGGSVESFRNSDVIFLKADHNSICSAETIANETAGIKLVGLLKEKVLPIDENAEIEENRTIELTNNAVPVKDEINQSQANGITLHYILYMIIFSDLDCLLDNWYFQKIPNNPRFSKVERDVCDEWIVLVGIKSEMREVHVFY